MRGYQPGAPRTKCWNCEGRSRGGQWVDWYGHKQYLCPKCLYVAQSILKEAAQRGENVESNLPAAGSKKYAGLTVVESVAGRDRGVHNQTAGHGPKGV